MGDSHLFQSDNIRPAHVPQKAYSFEAFNTINTVVLFGELDESKSATAFAALQREATRFERLFSHTLPESALYQYNHGAPAESLDPEFTVGLRVGSYLSSHSRNSDKRCDKTYRVHFIIVAFLFIIPQ